MASKRATSFILNASNSMKDHPNDAFQKARDMIIHSIENNVLTKRKTDLVSVLLAGTEETNNQLAQKYEGCYEHITEVCGLSQPFLPLIKQLSNVAVTGSASVEVDMLDALIIAVHMIEQKCKKLKYIKRIMILTDNTQEMDWHDFDEVKGMLLKNAIALIVVGIDLTDTTRQSENYVQWERLVSSIPDAYLVTLDEAMEGIYAFRSKDVRPTPVYKGFLYIANTPFTSTDFCAISCNMYLRTSDSQKPPSPSPYSLKSAGPTHRVLRERKYVTEKKFIAAIEENGAEVDQLDEDIDVDKTDLDKGFRFGKSVVKVSSEELEFAKSTQEKELTILGFVQKDAIPRDYMINKPYVVAAGEFNAEESGRAISALAHALYLKQVGALARWIQKKGDTEKVGVLLPYLEDGVSLLHFIQLPYCNDVRFYQFAPEPKPTSDPKDEEADRLMDEYVDKLDLDMVPTLDPDDKTSTILSEHLVPEEVFNPTVYIVNKAIKQRALNPPAPLPDLDSRLRANMEMLPEHQTISEGYGTKLQEIFQVKAVPKKKVGETKKIPAAPQNLLNIEDILREE